MLQPQEVKLQDISNALWSLATLRYWPQDESSSASSLDSDLVFLLSAVEDLVFVSTRSHRHDAELSQVIWSLVRMTAYDPSLLRHPRVSSLASSLISASEALFESISSSKEGERHLSLLSAWTLITGISRLVFLSSSLASSNDETTPSSSEPSSSMQGLVLSQEWLRAATDAAAIAVSSPRSCSTTPPRQRKRMSDDIVLSLQQLGALPEGDEGLMAWQDLVRPAASDHEVGKKEWEGPSLAIEVQI